MPTTPFDHQRFEIQSDSRESYMSINSIGPVLAALLAGAAIFYLFRMLQDSDRLAAQKLKDER